LIFSPLSAQMVRRFGAKVVATTSLVIVAAALKVPLPKGFARGGVLPGYTPGRDVHRFVSPTGGALDLSGGEAVMRPEWTAVVGEKYIRNANDAARKGGVRGVVRALGIAGDPGGTVPGFADGGIIGGIASFLKKGKDFFTEGIKNAAKVVVNPVLAAVENQMSGSPFTQSLAALPRRAVDAFVNWLGGKESAIGGPGHKAVAAARTRIGTPYSWGGGGLDGPSTGIGRGANTVGFDCSGLVRYGWYQAVKRAMPRTTYTQWPWSRHVDTPAEGDLGFTSFSSSTGLPEHVTMYSGNNKIIEAPYTGSFVREVPVRPGLHWGRPPASFLADKGGPIERGWNAILNKTGRREWILTPEAVDLLGGERAVARLNSGARSLYGSRNAAGPAMRPASTNTPQPVRYGEVHVHPQPRQTEEEIGAVAARRLGVMLR
ncbi:NlpC/P60 family protein, partial [Sphaerisporangium sp. NPDC049002]|uniref:NlpC/P60 family protein n=1 Tax=Sphaerisporangium sp. NPDC049002 TaxID=3155392 RepID=UPI003407494B